MSEEVVITYYGINECGYYERGDDVAKFGKCDIVLSQLADWAKGKTLAETKIFDTSENHQPTYCLDIEFHEDSNSFLLITWNEYVGSNDNLKSVNPFSSVGEVTINSRRPNRNSLVGYETYFWFKPANNIFATLRFNDSPPRLNGHKNMNSYISEFMKRNSPFAVKVRRDFPNNEIDILGYSKNGGKPENLFPKFSTYPLRKSTVLEEIKKNRERISGIIKRDTLSSSVSKQSLRESVFNFFGIADLQKTANEPRKIKVEFEHNPSESELEEILEHWQTEEEGMWKNLGFKLKGQDNPLWLDHIMIKNTCHLKLNKNDANSFETKSLLQALHTAKVTVPENSEIGS